MNISEHAKQADSWAYEQEKRGCVVNRIESIQHGIDLATDEKDKYLARREEQLSEAVRNNEGLQALISEKDKLTERLQKEMAPDCPRCETCGFPMAFGGWGGTPENVVEIWRCLLCENRASYKRIAELEKTVKSRELELAGLSKTVDCVDGENDQLHQQLKECLEGKNELWVATQVLQQQLAEAKAVIVGMLEQSEHTHQIKDAIEAERDHLKIELDRTETERAEACQWIDSEPGWKDEYNKMYLNLQKELCAAQAEIERLKGEPHPIPDTVFYCVLRRFNGEGNTWHKCETYDCLIDAQVQIERNRQTCEGEFMLSELRWTHSALTPTNETP
jgi:hypothetical protein